MQVNSYLGSFHNEPLMIIFIISTRGIDILRNDEALRKEGVLPENFHNVIGYYFITHSTDGREVELKPGGTVHNIITVKPCFVIYDDVNLSNGMLHIYRTFRCRGKTRMSMLLLLLNIA